MRLGTMPKLQRSYCLPSYGWISQQRKLNKLSCIISNAYVMEKEIVLEMGTYPYNIPIVAHRLGNKYSLNYFQFKEYLFFSIFDHARSLKIRYKIEDRLGCRVANSSNSLISWAWCHYWKYRKIHIGVYF